MNCMVRLLSWDLAVMSQAGKLDIEGDCGGHLAAASISGSGGAKPKSLVL
jgi:hypothetical protein